MKKIILTEDELFHIVNKIYVQSMYWDKNYELDVKFNEGVNKLYKELLKIME